MKTLLNGVMLCLACLMLNAWSARGALAEGEDNFYKLGPDSLEQEGVPRSKLVGPSTLPCEVFPGTQHTYWVYVPAQYDPAKPASLMIFNDGQAFIDMKGSVRVPNVLDNLIHRREIPVMIGVFINPGRRPNQPEPSPSTSWGDGNTNRPTEYNALNDKYPRVIVDELLPVLYKEYNISRDPGQHGIGGASSGGIAAFTVAWERPEHFRKVITFVGSFVDLARQGDGGSTYPDKILANDKKPVRIFLQDGRNDNRGVRRGGGQYNQKMDWFYQNVRMADALTKKGYDVNYAWGIGLHGQKQGGVILPDMMRWLWRDHAVSTDPTDKVERSFNRPAEKAEAAAVGESSPSATTK